MSESVRSLTRSALSAASGVVVLHLGSVLPTARMALLCLATLGVVFIATSCRYGWAWGCYLVTATAALLLLPEKTLAVIYAAFFGYYPILKLRLERIGNAGLRWILKLAAFNAAMIVLYAAYKTIFSYLVSVSLPVWILWIAANAAFAAYDYALGQLILYYLRKIAGRIK